MKFKDILENKDSLVRKAEVQAEYDQHLDQIKKAGHTPEEYIKNLWDRSTEDLSDVLLSNQHFFLIKNKFPYDLEGVNHWLLWYKGELLKPHAKKLLDIFFVDYVIFENKAKNKSVKGIGHYQVFQRLDILS
jgi:hypothetical protein